MEIFMPTELQIIGGRNILGMSVSVYGDFENPLFFAKDVAEWIEHSDVSTMLRNIDDDEKLIQTLFVSGQNRECWFLTESGLYEVLFLSRKPLAKEFKRGVKWLLHDLRTGKKTVDAPPVGDLRTYRIADRTITVPADTAFNVSISRLGAVTVRVNGKMGENRRSPGRPKKEFGVTGVTSVTGVTAVELDELDDRVRRFCEECCEFCPEARTSNTDIYSAWCRWSGDESVNRAIFFTKLRKVVRVCFNIDYVRSRQYRKARTVLIRGYQGIRLGVPLPESPPSSRID